MRRWLNRTQPRVLIGGGVAAALTLTLLVGTNAAADETYPSAEDVAGAQEEAASKERDVAAVRADLIYAGI